MDTLTEAVMNDAPTAERKGLGPPGEYTAAHLRGRELTPEQTVEQGNRLDRGIGGALGEDPHVVLDHGLLAPVLSAVRPLAQGAEAARLVQRDEYPGKAGVLCLAPRSGLGVTGPERRVATLDPRRHKPFAAGRQAAP